MAIDRATVDRIMDAANIVDVVSEFVSLRKRGTSYKGLCPFHDDTTPSFSVSPSRGVYKCFACGKAGNAVNFIMEHEQMTYVEALRWLANKYHIEIEEREMTDEERRQQNERESMFIVNEWAAKYFQRILHEHEDGRAIGLQYFRSRGFRDDIIERFRLGFCLNQRDAMAKQALGEGFKEEFLLKTGLCGKRDNGQYFDRFGGRVIFPWISVSGKVTAFGGRLLDSRTKGVAQKYVNSPDSDIYHKDHELYGIYQAKKAIVKEDRVYMVEGYTDVIAMHQCGIENVVANSGTALSVFQIKMLRRFTQNITLLYDGDEAGIHAAMRGTDMLLAEGMNIKVLLLPDNEDPDSFARSHTASDFRAYIEAHQTDFMEFKTTVLLKGVDDPIKRSEAISNIVKTISVIKDPIIRATYIKECSLRIGIAEQTLITQMNKFIRSQREEDQKTAEREARNQPPPEPLRPAEPTERMTKVEQLLIEMVMRHGEEVILNTEGQDVNVAQFIYYSLSEDGMSFQNGLYNKVLEEVINHCDEPGFKAETYFTHHSDIEINTLAAKLCTDRFMLSPSMQVRQEEDSLKQQVVHLLYDFQLGHVEIELQQLKRELKQCDGDVEKMMALMKSIKDYQELRNKIGQKLGRKIVGIR
ncbi:DNA primase [Prevotella sp. Rep29]|uniref:DNA primase n=1 Tax=Prevotella sp. Rep29 TaxID=2691580 RepID=UPI001C6E608B|nr:DNA primase [Prevotella sp. Rep29]QYR11175.1 DNA primase [Prevotella sp. Rep29]